MGTRFRASAISGWAVMSLTLAMASSAGAAAYPTVKLAAGLTPRFSKSVLDYVTKCPTGKVKATVTVPGGVRATLDSKSLTAGRTSVRSLKLSAGQRFTFAVGSGSSAVTHSVRCLPNDFPAIDATGRLPASVPFVGLSFPVLTGAVIPYALLVDSNGTPVWWRNTGGVTALDVKPAGPGLVGYWGGTLVEPLSDGPFGIYRLDGTKARDVSVVGGLGDPHEATLSPRGTWYRIASIIRPNVDMRAIGGPASASVVDQEVQEVDSSGAVVWRWRAMDAGRIGVAESAGWFAVAKAISMPQPFDVLHMNSIEEDADGGVIISIRHLDAIIRVRKSDGQIDWKLGGTPTARSLGVLGETSYPKRPLAMQHDARVLADGTLTAYDNGGSAKGRSPRAIRWRIDPIARTATIVEQLTDPAILSSAAGGSARRLADGGWLVSWSNQPYVRAYSAGRRLVFDLRFSTRGVRRSYRAAPFSESDVTRSQLLAGMDAQFPR